MYKSTTLLFIILTLSIFPNIGKTQVNVADSLALVTLYIDTGGPNWTETWDLSNPVSSWYGVSLKDGRVTCLDLSGYDGCSNVFNAPGSGNNLVGNLPIELSKLDSLEVLLLTNNELVGIIPPAYGDLSNLKHLNLYGNSLSGSIPTSLGQLTKLVHLNLRYNNLSGKIPPSLGNLSNLTHLYLSGGSMEPQVAPFKVFNDNKNQFTGAIPQELGNLTSLTHFYLGDGKLLGTIPLELGSLINLKYMSLHDNNLSGSIPPQLGNLVNLESLDLGYNRLIGVIPSLFGNLSNLKHLNLSNNKLQGEIPTSIETITNLQYLFLSHNRLSGKVPTNLNGLTFLYVNNNRLSGALPKLDNLKRLYVNNNLFSHDDIADEYAANALINDFNFTPQYYGVKQHKADTLGKQIILTPFPAITSPNPSVRWRKDGSFITGGFTLNDTIYIIPSLDTTDIGIYNFRYIDYTLTPLIEFRSAPIYNYVFDLDLEGETILTNELIVDLSSIPFDSLSIVQSTLNSFGGQLIDSCGCERNIYLYEFNSLDAYTILDTLGKVENSIDDGGVDGGFNREQTELESPNGTSRYLPNFFHSSTYIDSVIVAFLDTGVDISHPGIQGHLWINPETDDKDNGYLGDLGGYGYDFVEDTGAITDLHGHGTSVGGLIAENSPAEAAIQIMPVRIYGDTIGTLFNLICGIYYAVDNEADLINISVGYHGEKSETLENAIQTAEDNGVIIISSAGNFATNIDEELYWPASFANDENFSFSNFVTVAALDSTGAFWNESNYGSATIDFAVRGERLAVPTLGSYGYLTGTSASAPLATLTTAMLMASDNSRSHPMVLQELKNLLDVDSNLDTLIKGGKWLDIQLREEFMSLDLKLFLEGAIRNDNPNLMRTAINYLDLLPMNMDSNNIQHPYDTSSISGDPWSDTYEYANNVVDWVLLSLRSEVMDSSTTFYKTPAWLRRNGTVQMYAPLKGNDVDFNLLDSFYIVIEHRNHLPIATPVPLTKSSIVTYDFTQQDSYTNGSGFGQKQVSTGVWAMFAGNTSQNDLGPEEITGEDIATWSSDNGLHKIYKPTDVNLDTEINGEDKLIILSNLGAFSIIPE